MFPEDTPLPPLRQALQNLNYLNALATCEGWPWFVQRIQRRLEALTRQVMEDETLPEPARAQALTEYRALRREIIQAPAELRQAAERLLAEAHRPPPGETP